MYVYVYSNYVDTKTKCRHLKKFTFKGTLQQVFIRVYRQEIQYVVRVYTYKGGGVWASGPQTDKHLPQSPLTLIRMTKDEKGLAFFKGLLL
jgi:hypothetical protein